MKLERSARPRRARRHLASWSVATTCCIAFTLAATAGAGPLDQVALVEDINPAAPGASPSEITAAGGNVFFAADDGTNGREIWKSDGTADGTSLLKNINPGNASSTPQLLTPAGNTVFFKANEPATSGTELWKSDGTAAGTVLVKDIRPGPPASDIADLTAVGGKVFFRANDGSGTGEELWVSDGTGAGTVMVKDINDGGTKRAHRTDRHRRHPVLLGDRRGCGEASCGGATAQTRGRRMVAEIRAGAIGG